MERRTLLEHLSRAWHQSLYGDARLHNVGLHLERSCPWTRSTSSRKMLAFLKSECAELEEEITLLEQSSSSDKVNNTLELTKELGDIVFDTMLLAIACKREFHVDLQQCFQLAALKVERRTPYMLWGTKFTRAISLQQTEQIWQQQKALAKVANIESTSALTLDRNMNRPLRYVQLLHRYKASTALIAGACFGFFIGCAYQGR